MYNIYIFNQDFKEKKYKLLYRLLNKKKSKN